MATSTHGIEIVVPRGELRRAISQGVDIIKDEGEKYERYYTNPDMKNHQKHLKKWEMMFIDLPYAEKDEAKNLSKLNDAGLRWNPMFHCWVIPRQSEELFSKWTIEPLIPEE